MNEGTVDVMGAEAGPERPRRVGSSPLAHFETRAQRAAFVALSVLCVAALAVALASVGREIGRPWPGFVVWPNLVVPAIGAPRSGLPACRCVRC